MLNIIPLPNKYSITGGSFALSNTRQIIAGPDTLSAAMVLAQWLKVATGRELPVTQKVQPKSHDIVLSLSDGGTPESYRLTVKSDAILLEAPDSAGLIHAGASLWQLALTDPQELPCCMIDDSPRFGWRGFMLDCVRNFFPVSFILKLLDLAALHKLNVFHWHLTDDQAWRLFIPGMPELTQEGARRLDSRINWGVWKEGFYSPEDVSAVLEYAGARGINVIPEIETPGHSTALLASHPELSCRGRDGSISFKPEDRFGIFEDVLCVGNEQTLPFVSNVIDQVVKLFPSTYIHMGGDEVPRTRWYECPLCLDKMKSLGFEKDGQPDGDAFQAHFMKETAKILHSHGRKMLAWDEAAECGVPDDTIILAWRSHESGRAAIKSGYTVVMCPQTSACYLDHKHLDEEAEPGQLGVCTVKNTYEFDPMIPGLTEADEKKVLGAQANLWTEMVYFSRQAEYMLFPRLSALSETAWTLKEKKELASFEKRMLEHGKRLDILDVARFRGAYHPDARRHQK